VASSCEFGIEPSGSIKCWETAVLDNRLTDAGEAVSLTRCPIRALFDPKGHIAAVRIRSI
jgi:hypothetical protein